MEGKKLLYVNKVVNTTTTYTQNYKVLISKQVKGLHPNNIGIAI